jgi:hypothetical protein
MGGGRGDGRDSVSSRLTEGLAFPSAVILNGDIPDATAGAARIMPIGATPVASPGNAGLMALDVDDPDKRGATATLMQFGDDDRHLSVPVPDDYDGGPIDNPFTVDGELCEGLCDTVYSVLVSLAVELQDGSITDTTESSIIVDCLQDGDPLACDEGDPEQGVTIGLTCNDLDGDAPVVTLIPEVDRYFDAVRRVEDAAEVTTATLRTAIADMATAFELSPASSADAIATSIEAEVAAGTSSGLDATLGEQGCGVASGHALATVNACDADFTPTTEIDCLGDCRLSDTQADCPTATEAGCRGLVEDAACGGVCTGACEVMLDGEGCNGKCTGMCDGSCPGFDANDCDGACEGNCTGTCRALSDDATCGGSCDGLCDDVTQAQCIAPMRRVCSATMAPEACEGQCFGTPSIDGTTPLCDLNGRAVAQLFPVCVPPLVQLSFTFADGLSNAEQDVFASHVAALSEPIVGLLDAMARADLVALAGADLEAAADTLAQSAVDDALSDDAEGASCAESTLGDVSGLIGAALSSVEDARMDAMLVLDGTINPSN